VTPELDKLWIAEAHNRLDAYDRGEIQAVNVEDVFRSIDERQK